MENQSTRETSDNLNLINSKISKNSCLKSIPKRYVLAIFSFFGFFFAYILRANLSVAIVQMSRKNELETDDLIINQSANSTHSIRNDNLKWSTSLQGYILSSFFYGYIVTQLPAGYWTNKYGGKLFFGLGIGICSILSLFIPLAANAGPGFVIALRTLQGLTQGVIYPAMHCLWSKWSPPFERSRLTTFALSGSYVGTVCAMSLGGIIGKELNWESIFYIFGAAALTWSILWFIFIFESPKDHKSILIEERNFVESSITHQASSTIPWSKIFRSPAVWAIISAHCAENWGFYTLLTELPTFMADNLNYKVDKAGLISSLPYLTMAIVLYISGYTSDYLIEKKKIECTIVRKSFCCFGLITQGFFMFLITTIINKDAIVVFITLAVGFGGMAWAAFGVNQLDIGSGYANIVMSISNFFATIPGIFSPILAGHIIESKEKADWNIVFYISAVIFFIGAIFYAFFGSGELQLWASQASNYDDLNKDNQDKTKNDINLEKIN